MSMLKVACLCLLVLAVCGPVVLARNYFERCFDDDVVLLTDFVSLWTLEPVMIRSAYDYVDDSDLVAKTPQQPSNVNKDGNQRFFGGAYKAGYGAFKG